MIEILGLSDPWVLGGYLGSIAITIICIVYGVIYWNSDD